MKPKILEYKIEALLRFDPADAGSMHEILEQCRKHGVVKIKSVRLRKITVNDLPGHQTHMDLTEERKAHIDSLSYEGLLSRWRFAPIGDPWFQGETGDYWGKRMSELRAEPGGDERHVRASKSLGWRK